MTTVEFGGGPTLAARQQFANLKPNGAVPKFVIFRCFVFARN